MKVVTEVSFSPGPRPWSVIRDLLIRAGQPEVAEKGRQLAGYTVLFEDDPTAADRLVEELDQHGLVTTVRRSIFYDDNEIADAPMVLLWPPVYGSSGVAWGTEFDFTSACPTCGTGARPEHELRVEVAAAPRSAALFVTEDDDILISEDLVERLRQEFDATIDVIDAVSVEGEPLPWKAVRDLPRVGPLDGTSGGVHRERPCARCDRDGFFFDPHESPEFRYAPHLMANRPPLAFTTEHWGNSVLRSPLSDSHFAAPRLLARPDAYEAIRALGGEDYSVDVVSVTGSGAESEPEEPLSSIGDPRARTSSTS